VSGQLLTVTRSLGTNQEQVGCLLLIAASLSSSVGGKLTFVKPLHDLQFLPRLSIFNQLPLVLLTHAFDNLGYSLYTPQAQERTYNLKLKLCSGHSFLQALRQRPSPLKPALPQSSELLLRVHQVMG
jgi:hypothetical protein